MNYYIHVPFCASKCGYCVFYSETVCSEELFDRYLEKIFSGLSTADKAADTVYIGGGTPTVFDAARLERFLETVCSALKTGSHTEISIESNPETLTSEKVAILKRYVNRISTGVQSFFPEARNILGRKCSDLQLRKALALVAEAGFSHWNCDLIYAVPGRSVSDWEKEFDELAGYPVDHVSCYNLTPEEGARLYGTLDPAMDIAADLEKVTLERLEALDIHRYEVSNYARNGAECRHNINVWRGGLLKGFGPSAAGFDGHDRMSEAASLSRWLNGEPAEIDRIPHSRRLDEIFAVNLRTVAGWNRESWLAVPGADSWGDRLRKAGEVGKIMPGCFEITGDVVKLTPEGLSFWDSVAEELLV